MLAWRHQPALVIVTSEFVLKSNDLFYLFCKCLVTLRKCRTVMHDVGGIQCYCRRTNNRPQHGWQRRTTTTRRNWRHCTLVGYGRNQRTNHGVVVFNCYESVSVYRQNWIDATSLRRSLFSHFSGTNATTYSCLT